MCALNIIVLQALYLTAEHLLGHLRSSAGMLLMMMMMMMMMPGIFFEVLYIHDYS